MSTHFFSPRPTPSILWSALPLKHWQVSYTLVKGGWRKEEVVGWLEDRRKGVSVITELALLS